MTCIHRRLIPHASCSYELESDRRAMERERPRRNDGTMTTSTRHSSRIYLNFAVGSNVRRKKLLIGRH